MNRQNHPERRDGEIFNGNVFGEGWRQIGWKSLRLGCTAYDRNGNVVPDSRPVFIERSEIEFAIEADGPFANYLCAMLASDYDPCNPQGEK